MQGKKPSKSPSLLRKGVLAKEKFNLDQKWEKYSTTWPIILPHPITTERRIPYSSHIPVVLTKLSITYSVMY